MADWRVPEIYTSVICPDKNMLVAIAAMSLMSKDCRTQVNQERFIILLLYVNIQAAYNKSTSMQAIDAKVLPHVVAGLSHRSTSVRLAACKCARSLSRSVKEVRTSLVEANVTPPLLKVIIAGTVVLKWWNLVDRWIIVAYLTQINWWTMRGENLGKEITKNFAKPLIS